MHFIVDYCINYWTPTSIDHLGDIRKSKKRGCKTIPTDTLPVGTFCTPFAYVGI